MPEVALYMATEVSPLWRASVDVLESNDLPPPYWAFAWAGGQALARYVLDHPERVEGQRVLVFAAGGGIDAIAAVLAGAANVTANEIDPVAVEALRLNAPLNAVTLDVLTEDVCGQVTADWDVVLAGDVFYEQPMADRTAAWLKRLAEQDVEVLVADPGRTYLPSDALEKVAEYLVPTSTELEDASERLTGVYRWRRGGAD